MSESKGKAKGSAAQRIQPEFVHCRALGHSYDIRTSKVERAEYGRLDWSIKCYCGTERIQRLSKSGMILSTKYHYPQGYLLTGEILDKSAKGEIRLRLVFER